ncbi:MAG: N-glycosylase/DNA lyase [Archaeoglobi archaeon]|nr:N-glycosylase/DNA lyase [Archaeoglobi archaeon]MDK2781725.1 N-glycosylase/DNA lyase [Archaeoglobi archaeon]
MTGCARSAEQGRRNLKRLRNEELLRELQFLRNSEISEVIRKRIEEFIELGNREEKEIFKELCFCILTANFRADRCIEIQRRIDDGFLNLSFEELRDELRKLGHRYPERRAEFIVEARKHIGVLKGLLEMEEREAREWLVRNIRGVGYKEASHFLRNVGKMNVAIIDKHIMSILSEFLGIEKPRSMTRRRYLEMENILRGIAEEVGLSLGELDLYLWFMKTGKVLK